jgi:hypothetical protein
MLPGLTYEYPHEAGPRTVSLRPLENPRFEWVIWGASLETLRHASHLEPTITRPGRLDYVVDNGRCCWEGAAGVYEADSSDRSWPTSPAFYHGIDATS